MDRMIKAILFDLNETLIHQIRTERSHIASTYASLTQYYWDLTYESFEEAWIEIHSKYNLKFKEGIQFVKDGNLDAAKIKLREHWYRKNIAEIVQALQIDVPKRVIEKVTWAFQDSWVGGLRMPNENLITLKNLSSDGYQIGLVTNFQQPDIIVDILESFGMGERLFNTISISANIELRKPFPEIFNVALQELDMAKNPGQVVYVGDNPEEDVVGARQAGLRPILIDRKGIYSVLEKDVFCIKSIQELPQILDKINSGLNNLSVGT